MFRLARVQGETLIIIKPLCRPTWVLISTHSCRMEIDQSANQMLVLARAKISSFLSCLSGKLLVVGLFQVLATNNYANAVDARHYCHYVDVLPIMSSSLSSALIGHKHRVPDIVINFNGAKLAR